ncbi:BgTH12-05992 [Blumeria graminis f. sp. triticale]|uniref:BgTH12-05992 n=1 Tax=Blumeria graminis f. sp. triticale TaxID=1689686 RepID=A0A9W4D551_BLUGR|nr:BgTH12-05992 [Blumeria graminis f. sp. triticale]
MSHFIPLLSSILSKAADVGIWSHIPNLVDKLELISPLQYYLSSSQHPEARHRHMTAQLQVADKTMKKLKDAFRKELTGTVFENVEGLCQTFLEKLLSTSKYQKISESFTDRRNQK